MRCTKNNKKTKALNYKFIKEKQKASLLYIQNKIEKLNKFYFDVLST